MPPSSYPKYFDLNIGNVLEHLEIEDSLKEIISNGLDEHILTESKRDIRIYKNDNNNWCIRDYGRGIKSSNFKFDINNDKQDNHDIIGMYGYGLKDAIGNLFHRKIIFKIYTKSYIITPIMRPKEDFPDEETLHMEIIKNTTYEINRGTEFIFDNLTLENITKAKEKFMKFLKPNILFELNDYKIFRLNSFQSIFVNGVEVHQNTGYHFSYDIKSSDDIKKCFNRDRKQLDLQSLEPYITKVLKKLSIYNNQNQEDQEDQDDQEDEQDNVLLKYIRDILKLNSGEYLQEFNRIDILRNVISQINNQNKFVFVGSKEKLTKNIKEKIKNDNKEVFILGDGVKSRFRVKNIKDLYFNENFYRDYNENTQHINTLLNYIDQQPDNIDVPLYISNILKPIEKLFTLPTELKNKLLNIEVIKITDDLEEDNDSDGDDDGDTEDDSSNEEINTLEKDGFDFSGEKLKITSKYVDERKKKDLFVILFRYIVNNIDDKNIIDFSDKISDKNSGSSWYRRFWM